MGALIAPHVGMQVVPVRLCRDNDETFPLVSAQGSLTLAGLETACHRHPDLYHPSGSSPPIGVSALEPHSIIPGPNAPACADRPHIIRSLSVSVAPRSADGRSRPLGRRADASESDAVDGRAVA